MLAIVVMSSAITKIQTHSFYQVLDSRLHGNDKGGDENNTNKKSEALLRSISCSILNLRNLQIDIATAGKKRSKKFPPKADQPQAEVQVKDKNTIMLTISDNGIGIDEEVLPNLFSRYYQVESRSGSAGIGLSIVKWIVEGHGGTIEIKSKKGEGAKMIIRFQVD